MCEGLLVAPRESSIRIPTRSVVLAKRRELVPEIIRDDPLETADTWWEEGDTIPWVIPWLIDLLVVTAFVLWKESLAVLEQ